MSFQRMLCIYQSENSIYYLFLLIWLSLFTNLLNAQFDGIYCGTQNCYDVLKVTRDDDRKQIRKAYHELARKHHPDRQRTAEARKEAEEYFRLINTAYEILSDPAQRESYDYMLDNPDQMYYHYYQYYRGRYGPKIDVRLVILSIILIISTVQYIGQKTSYDQALTYLVRDPKHRARAKQLASLDGRLNLPKREIGRRLTREELKEREEELLRTIIKETVELKGDCCKPSFKRVLAVQIVLFPWTCYKWIYWCLHWIINYWILRRPYNEDAKIFLTRYRLGMNAAAWESLDADKKEGFMNENLWIKENHKAFMLKQAEKARLDAAADSQQKRLRRYIKRYGGLPQANVDEL